MHLLKKLQAHLVLVPLSFCILQLVVSTDAFAKPSFNNQPDLCEEPIGKKVFEVCRIQVKARPDKVWSILTDYRNSPNIFATMKKCEVVQDRGDVKVMRHVIHPSGYPGTFDYVVEVSGTAPRTLEWHRISGAFKEVDGYWKLEPAEGGCYTNVTYAAYINGGFLFPSFLVRDQMKDDLPNVLVALKNSAEGVPTATQIAHRTESTSTHAARGLVMQPAYAAGE